MAKEIGYVMARSLVDAYVELYFTNIVADYIQLLD